MFPLHKYWNHWWNLIWTVRNIPCGRIIVFGITGNGSGGLRRAKTYLSSLGSFLAANLLPGTNWVWVYVQCGATVVEAASVIGQPPLHLHLLLPFQPRRQEALSEKERLKRRVCDRNEILGHLCDQTNLEVPDFAPSIQVRFENLQNVPVVITAGGRIHYFYYTLKTLLRTPGIDKKRLIVIVGGAKQNFVDLLTLFGIHFKVLEMYGEENAMLFQYYRRVYQYVNETFPSSPAAIFLDEDVRVSPDFFYYMNQTIPLLERDPTIYCINSYSTARGNKLCGDPTQVLRGTAQVTWGYAVPLRVVRAAVSMWPENPFLHALFDLWIMKNVTNLSECVFPERSRSFHFGIDGQNYQSSVENEAFSLSIPVVESYGVQLSNLDRMTLSNWTSYLTQDINGSEVLQGNPCRRDFLPTNATGSFSFYFSWDKVDEANAMSFVMAGMCQGFWALSLQGHHDGVITLRPTANSTLHLIAFPASNYSHLKPGNVTPWNYEALSESEQLELENYKNKLYFPKNESMSVDVLKSIKHIYQVLFNL